MSLESVLEEAKRRRKSLVHYAPEPGDFADQFAARNVDVTYRPLPIGGPEPFVVVRQDGTFCGAITVGNLRRYLWPPIRRPRDLDALSPAYRALFELLDDAVFASLRRRQLLATAREIEDRAQRTGRGTLHAGFQSPSAFRPQRSVYRQLAAATDLDIHVYVGASAATADLETEEIALHAEGDAGGGEVAENEVGRFWFLAFDGGGDDGRKCALVAEQRDSETYYGVWTYDPALVDRTLAADVLAR